MRRPRPPDSTAPIMPDVPPRVAERGPRTILFVDHTASLGGGEIALLALVRRLDPGRYKPVVLLCADGPFKELLVEAGVETHVLPLSDQVANTRKDALGGRSLLRIGAAAAIFAYIVRLARFMRHRRVDLVHTNSLKADVIGGFAARLAGKTVVWHVRDRIAGDYLPRSVAWAFRTLSRLVPNAVIANSMATLETMRLPKSKHGRVIPSGIDLSAHDRAQSTSDNAGGARIVGLVGRISPWKGQHIFIEAAAEIHRRFPEVRFQIVGAALFEEVAYDRGLRDMVRSLGLGDCVAFTGFQKDVPSVMARLEILVHASTTAEPFGQVVVQGMASSKPVVATAGGGILDIVRDGETGLLVPMGDARAMAEAICSLLERPKKGLEMGRAGLSRVRDQFTIERTVAQIEAFYDAVLADADKTGTR